MFCPQCDRVYLKAKVCPHCGVKLLRATGKPERKPIVPPKSAVSSTAEIRCPNCGSANYRRDHSIRHRLIRNGSLWIQVMFAVAYLYLIIRGLHLTYHCRECGHEWIPEKRIRAEKEQASSKK